MRRNGLRSLISGDHIGSNSEGDSEISGSAPGRIAKTSLYGEEKEIRQWLGNRKDKESANRFSPESQECGRNG